MNRSSSALARSLRTSFARSLAMLSALVATASLEASAHAAAETDATAQAAHTVNLGTTIGELAFIGRGQGFLATQLAADYSLSPLWSVGGVATYGHGNENDGEHLGFVTAQGRLHAIHTRWVELWTAGQVGLAMSYAKGPNVSCLGGPCGASAPIQAAPIFGLGLGVDVFPTRYLSVGIEGRSLIPFFARSNESPGTRPGLFAGASIAMHFPIAE